MAGTWTRFAVTAKLYPLFICFTVLLHACGTATPYHLTIAHLNDTHSHMEATPVSLSVNGAPVTVELGGFAHLQTLVDEMRAEEPNLILLHAGDAVQGSMYFTLFGGALEFELLNRLGVTAMTLGNHEFDRGVAAIPAFLDRAAFPVISANIDCSAEPALSGRINRAIITQVHGERIGVFGLTTETTPQSTTNVGKVQFTSAVEAARRQVAELRGKGVNKIIALTHLGYEADLRLAEAVDGIDIIVGGHSHTLLGDPPRLMRIGLKPVNGYPTEVRTPDGGLTLVTQAWQWGHVLGNLRVQFDDEGKVTGYQGKAILPMGDALRMNGVTVPQDSPVYREISQQLQAADFRNTAENPAITKLLAPYTAQVAAYRHKTVATAREDLRRGLNSGPGQLAALAMLDAAPRAKVALFNFGGVRKDLLAGAITVADIMEVSPFGNTLVLVDLSGGELKQALEEGIEFLRIKYGQKMPAVPYVAGIRFSVNFAAGTGKRIGGLMIGSGDGTYRPVDFSATYRTVVNNFVAGGGDGFNAIKSARGFRTDTGIIDSDALRDYLTKLINVRNPQEKPVTLINGTPEAQAPVFPFIPQEKGLPRVSYAAGLY